MGAGLRAQLRHLQYDRQWLQRARDRRDHGDVLSFFVSTCIWLPALPFLSIDTIPVTAETIFFIGFICIVATIIPYWLLMYGLRQVDALPATVIGMLDPVAAGTIAWLLVGERLTAGNVAGIAIIIAAVTMATMADHLSDTDSHR